MLDASTGWFINRENWSTRIYEVAGSEVDWVPVTVVNGATGVPYSQQIDSDNPAFSLAGRFAAGVPIPEGAQTTGGTDTHLVVIDTETGEYWGMFATQLDGRGIDGWSCEWGGWIPDHRENIGRYEEITSPRQHDGWGEQATNLPIAAGLILNEELHANLIPHALHVVLPDPDDAIVWPAARGDGYAGKVIPEGSVFRIKPSVDVTAYTPPDSDTTDTLHAIATAMQTYGVIVTDKTGAGQAVTLRAEMVDSNLFDWGGWVDLMLNTIPVTDFEFIDPSYRPA